MSSTSYLSTALVAAAVLFGSVNGHMTLKTPAPYGASSLDTSPLEADGSNFPCKQRAGVYAAASTTNSYAIGADVPLSFSGSASHGGGSCQISLSTDKAPTKDSKWMVIHSIEGGCPVKDSGGNTGSDTYTFKVPEGVQPGDYTLAWTWFNRIGNREMYMNCAPFTVTGGSSKTKRAMEARKSWPLQEKRDNGTSSFPDMYVANICSQKCIAAPEPNYLVFPSPGTNVDLFGASMSPAQTGATATCTCDVGGLSAVATPAAGSSGSSGSGSGSGSSSSAVSSGAAPAVTSAAATGSGSTSNASSGSATSGGDNGILSVAVATATVASTAQPAAAASTGASGNSTGSSSTTSSNTSGSLRCSSDGTKFGIESGSTTVMQAVAPGTKCVNGAITAA